MLSRGGASVNRSGAGAAVNAIPQPPVSRLMDISRHPADGCAVARLTAHVSIFRSLRVSLTLRATGVGGFEASVDAPAVPWPEGRGHFEVGATAMPSARSIVPGVVVRCGFRGDDDVPIVWTNLPTRRGP